MKPSAGRPSGSPRCCQTGSGTGSNVAAGLPGPGQKKTTKHLSDTDDMEGRTDGRMGELINAFVFFSQNALCSTSLPVFACCSICRFALTHSGEWIVFDSCTFKQTRGHWFGPHPSPDEPSHWSRLSGPRGEVNSGLFEVETTALMFTHSNLMFGPLTW